MRKGDVVIGESYGYKPYTHDREIKVTVLSGDEPLVYYKHTGFKVRFESGGEKGVPARHLSRPWAEIEEEKERRLKRDIEAHRMEMSLNAIMADIKAELDRHGFTEEDMPICIPNWGGLRLRIDLYEKTAQAFLKFLRSVPT